MHLSVEGKGSKCCQVIDQKAFFLQGQYDFDLRLLEPKMNMAHLQAKTNLPLKFEDQSLIFKFDVTLKFDPLNQKTLGVNLWSLTIPEV
jgi:hypothetical protein